MPLWKWSFCSGLWAIPFGIVFAMPIGLAVMLMWILLCVDTFGPDPVEHPIPQWRIDLGDVVLAPGMAVANCLPRDALAGSGRLIRFGVEYFLIGFPYALTFFFLLFTILGLTPLNRVPVSPKTISSE